MERSFVREKNCGMGDYMLDIRRSCSSKAPALPHAKSIAGYLGHELRWHRCDDWEVSLVVALAASRRER